MIKPWICVATALVTVAAPACAAEWDLSFKATYILWHEDAPFHPLTDLQLHITTENRKTRSVDANSLGRGYKITAVTGTRNGQTITWLPQSDDPFYYFGQDNYLYNRNPQLLSLTGLAYKTADGTLFNLYGATSDLGGGPEVQWWEMTSWASLSPYSPYVTFQGELKVSRTAP